MSTPTRSTLVAVLIGSIVGILVLSVALVFVVRGDSGGTSEPAQGQLAAAPEETTTPEPEETPVPESDTNGAAQRPHSAGVKPGVRSLPTGLGCDELQQRGVDYTDMVEYWRYQEMPAEIEVDVRGVPCESRYPKSDVAAYWGTYDQPSTAFRPGLYCRDLYAAGASYADAVAYWFSEGAPDRMDADLNGIPCETVYLPSDVAAYWGDYAVPQIPYETGLYCRDLEAMGATYGEAVAYWFAQGAPDRMDADLNGIPCETVYPPTDVAAYWGIDSVPGVTYAPGLYCRDLYALGASYSEAVAYWFSEGAPDRMDADLNEIPCETVYPLSVIEDYWFG